MNHKQKMNGKIFIPIILLLFFIPGIAASDITFLPAKAPLINRHVTLLNPCDIDIAYIYSSIDDIFYARYNFGIKLVIFHMKTNNNVEIESCGFGEVIARFELFSDSFYLVHSDFLGGVSFDIKYKRFLFETMVYHLSSHLGDDYRHYYNEPYLNVGFETIKHYTNYHFSDMFVLSGGLEYKFGRRPADLIFYDLSVILGAKIDFVSKGIPVFIESESEIFSFHHTPNFGVKTGLYLFSFINNTLLKKGLTEEKNHELYFQYYYGYSQVGYYFDKKESLLVFGISFIL